MSFRLISRQAQMVRSYYSGIGKTPVTCVAAFLMATALGTVMLGMVFYLQEVFGASGGQVGVCFGIWSFSYVSGCLFLRPLTDSIKPRYLLVASSFSMFSMITAVLLCGSFPLASMFFGLAAASASMFWPPMMGWLSVRLQGAELSRAMSQFNISWSSGTVVSPYLAGWLSEKQVALPIQVGAGLMLLTSFLILGAALTLPKLRNDRDSSRPDPQQTESDTGTPTRLRYATWISLFTAFAILGVFSNIFPMAGRDVLGLRKSLIGVLLLSRTLLTTIGFAALGRMAFWHYRGRYVLLGQVVSIGVLVTLIFLSHPALIGLCMAVFGLMLALSYFNALFHGLAGSANRVGRSAIHEALLNLGMVAGSVVGGQIYQRFSIQRVYLYGVLLIIVSMVIQSAIIAWTRKHEPHPHIHTAKGAEHDEG